MGWKKEDDAKLFSLFRKPVSKGGLDPNHQTPKDIRTVITKHWPGRKCESFAPLCRRKCQQFLTEKSVAGARSKGIRECLLLCCSVLLTSVSHSGCCSYHI